MFKGCNLSYIRFQDVLSKVNQEDLFLKYIGIYPDLNKRYSSPFRNDKDPGCRFQWYSGILYFVDNTAFRGKLYWSIFDMISYIKGCSFLQALHLVSDDNNIKDNFVFKKQSIKKTSTDIRFTYQDWPEDNLFKLPNNILQNEYVYLVKDYWITKDGNFKKNMFFNPKDELTIAYYFPDTNKTKLYFPYVNKKDKWISNCSNNEVFGKYKLKQYQKETKDLIITKSQKDRITLDYHLNIPAIATQNEGCIIPDNIIKYLKENFNLKILFDNDNAGLAAAEKISNKYEIPYIILDSDKKDTYENFITYGKEKTINLINNGQIKIW